MRLDNSDWGGHRVDLLRYLGRRVDDAALREDIVQEAIVRLLVYEAKPGIVISNVTGLLRRISLDLTRDHFRRIGRNRVVELSDDLPCQQSGIQERLEQRQLVAIIIDVVKAMPRLRREVFFRRRVEEQSAKEVAQALGISPGAVDAHIARAVLDLHLAIEKIEKRGGPVRG
ncbi:MULTISPECIES: RNA polymerase sigma factor [Edaphosphingomonas]|uniref:RNA polymerase sigma factor n=2 Tax=Edaphosphingomonas TaxID=3423724 RepID=A0A2T4I6M7_9SPHN|nr:MULTISPECIES: RNA polymerase sigma factor [Sphingomonas]OHT20623.1 RNA polymerase sigma factor [Sphingomonas haloaromaticamans]PTD26288.1 RNA polymerase sigma factor [Sphingomonas fennica]